MIQCIYETNITEISQNQLNLLLNFTVNLVNSHFKPTVVCILTSALTSQLLTKMESNPETKKKQGYKSLPRSANRNSLHNSCLNI